MRTFVQEFFAQGAPVALVVILAMQEPVSWASIGLALLMTPFFVYGVRVSPYFKKPKQPERREGRH